MTGGVSGWPAASASRSSEVVVGNWLFVFVRSFFFALKFFVQIVVAGLTDRPILVRFDDFLEFLQTGDVEELVGSFIATIAEPPHTFSETLRESVVFFARFEGR
jgi:hypothetical protein